MSGQRIGRLFVLSRVGNLKGKATWICKCDCGKNKVVSGHVLRKGKVKSCGCYGNEVRAKRIVANRNKRSRLKHGESVKGQRTDRYDMFIAARLRADKHDRPFSLVLDDIPEMPKTCPILGIPIFRSKWRKTDNSPSLDRIDNQFGYDKGNVRIISLRANYLKGNSNSDELASVLLDVTQIEQAEVDQYALS
jgi:hypothetical protein